MKNIIIGMKITFHQDVQLKTDYGCRRTFAILVPKSCETVGNVKAYITSEFCENQTPILNICIDSVYSLLDKDSIDVILYYSTKDKQFQCSAATFISTTSSTYNTLLDCRHESINALDSSVTETDCPTETLKTRRILSPKRRLEYFNVGDGRENEPQSCPYPISVHGAPKKVNELEKLGVEVTPEVTDMERPTRSAKRRERLRRTVAKRLCLTPKGAGLDSGNQNKENVAETYGDETKEEETEALPATDNIDAEDSVITELVPAATACVLKSNSKRNTPRDRRENTKLCFVSEIIRNDDTSTAPIKSPIDYDTIPIVTNFDAIKVQDMIVFKVWEFGEGGPGISNYKEARVVSKTDDGKLALEYTTESSLPDAEVNIEGYVVDDSLGCSTNMDFTRLICPKILESKQ